MNRRFFGIFTSLCLLFSVTVSADEQDDDFEEYITAICESNPFDRINNEGWTIQDITDFDNDVCLVYLPSGSIVSSANYQSSSNIGSTGAQNTTSNASAQQQVDGVKDRLDEILEEEPGQGGWGLLLSAQRGETERSDTVNEAFCPFQNTVKDALSATHFP